VSAVLQLVSEMTAAERAELREELAIDERAAAQGRKAPRVSQAIREELETRFVNDTAPGTPFRRAIRAAVKTARARRPTAK
jgi:hypothetical protein